MRIGGRVLLLLAPLAACSAFSSLHAVSATADGVVLEYSDDRSGDAAREATLYCANIARRAELSDLAPAAEGGYRATFACR